MNCDTLMVEPTNYLLVSDISKGSDKMSKLPIPTAGGKQVTEDVEFILIGAGEFGIHNIYLEKVGIGCDGFHILEKAPTKVLDTLALEDNHPNFMWNHCASACLLFVHYTSTHL